MAPSRFFARKRQMKWRLWILRCENAIWFGVFSFISFLPPHSSSFLYGSDSDDDSRHRDDEGFVELKPEVVEFRTLHKREEELYFYDAFAYPWEKEKHYRMVYQLEKKYFPDQCFDKAFLQPGESNSNAKVDRVKKIVGKKEERKEKAAMDGRDEKGLVFFEDEAGKDERDKGSVKDVKIDVSERKVEEFFKCLKKVPNKNADIASAEPFVSTRSTGLYEAENAKPYDVFTPQYPKPPFHLAFSNNKP